MKKLLQEEHSGFAITFEVLITVTMIFTFFFLILFVLMVMNGQRFMNTVLTSTAAEASRWGGVKTAAYASNVGGADIITSAQSQLNSIIPEFFPQIKGTPNKILNDGDNITITISYKIPSAFSSFGTVARSTGGSYNMYSDLSSRQTMSIKVKSIMKAGRLL